MTMDYEITVDNSGSEPTSGAPITVVVQRPGTALHYAGSSLPSWTALEFSTDGITWTTTPSTTAGYLRTTTTQVISAGGSSTTATIQFAPKVAGVHTITATGTYLTKTWQTQTSVTVRDIDLALSLTEPSSTEIGAPFDYIFTVTNAGASATDATTQLDIQIDPINGRISYLGVTSGSGTWTYTYSANGTDYFSSPPTGTRYVRAQRASSIPIAGTDTVTLTVERTINGVAHVEATVTHANDRNSANNTVVSELSDSGTPDILIAIAVSDDTPLEGDAVVFTITAQNTSPIAFTGVVVLDDITAQLTGETVTGHSASHGTYTPSTGNWSIGGLGGLVTATLTVNVTLSPTSGNTMPTITAQLNASTPTDVNPSNNSDSVQLQISYRQPVASFTISDDSIVVGDTVTFTDTSQYSITSRQWDVDDDGVIDGTGTTLEYTFTRAGVYEVWLRVTGGGGTHAARGLVYVADTWDSAIETLQPLVDYRFAESSNPILNTGALMASANGTSAGSVTLSQTIAHEGANQAILIVGSTGRVEIPANTLPFHLYQRFTMLFYVWLDGYGHGGNASRLFDVGGSTTYVAILTSGRIQVQVDMSTSDAFTETSSGLPTGTPVLVAVTFDNTHGDKKIRVYWDTGSGMTEAAYASQVAGSGSVVDKTASIAYVGNRSSADRGLNGYIGRFSWLNKPIDSVGLLRYYSRVLGLYADTATPSGWTYLQTATGNTDFDSVMSSAASTLSSGGKVKLKLRQGRILKKDIAPITNATHHFIIEGNGAAFDAWDDYSAPGVTWTQSGSNWYATWDYNFGASGDVWTGIGAPHAPSAVNQRGEIVRRNGTIIRQVGALANLGTVGEDAFYIDETANRIYINFDPARDYILASAAVDCWRIENGDVVAMRDMLITGYATRISNEGIAAITLGNGAGAPNNQIAQCHIHNIRITACGGPAIKPIYAGDVEFYHLANHHCGISPMVVNGARSNRYWRYLRFTRNGWRARDSYEDTGQAGQFNWESGPKIHQQHGTFIRDLYSHDNIIGFWPDYALRNCTIYNATITNNWYCGLILEKSANWVLENITLSYNGCNGAGGWMQGALLIGKTQGVTIYSMTAEENGPRVDNPTLTAFWLYATNESSWNYTDPIDGVNYTINNGYNVTMQKRSGGSNNLIRQTTDNLYDHVFASLAAINTWQWHYTDSYVKSGNENNAWKQDSPFLAMNHATFLTKVAGESNNTVTVV